MEDERDDQQTLGAKLANEEVGGETPDDVEAVEREQRHRAHVQRLVDAALQVARREHRDEAEERRRAQDDEVSPSAAPLDVTQQHPAVPRAPDQRVHVHVFVLHQLLSEVKLRVLPDGRHV